MLTKGLISDQLGFVGIAKDLFTIADLQAIRRRRIGRGKIGGKAAGMMLAWKILNLDESNQEMDLRSHIVLPESYFIGADVFYDFMSLNDLHYLHDQKYKTTRRDRSGLSSRPRGLHRRALSRRDRGWRCGRSWPGSATAP